MVSKWKKTIRKEHVSFLVFNFWDLKLVPIDSTLNFASRIVIFSKYVDVLPRIAAKLWNPG